LPDEAAAEVAKGYLRQSDYTKKRMADAEARRKWDEERGTEAQHLAALKSILSDPRKQAAFIKAMGEGEAEAPEAVDLLADPKDAAKAVRGIVKQELTASEREAAAREAEVDAKEASIRSAVTEYIDTVKESVPTEEMRAILADGDAYFSKKPGGILAVDPGDVVDRLQAKVDLFLERKRASEAEARLSKKAADAARSAKASSSPSTRAATTPTYDLSTQQGRLEKSLADLGIDDWTKVPIGNRGPGRPV
jgi:hypothetical protein